MEGYIKGSHPEKRCDCGPHNSLDGRSRGPFLEVGYHGQRKFPVHWNSSAYQKQVRRGTWGGTEAEKLQESSNSRSSSKKQFPGSCNHKRGRYITFHVKVQSKHLRQSSHFRKRCRELHLLCPSIKTRNINIHSGWILWNLQVDQRHCGRAEKIRKGHRRIIKTSDIHSTQDKRKAEGW